MQNSDDPIISIIIIDALSTLALIASGDFPCISSIDC